MLLYQKRYGDRKDGRRVRTIDPMNRISAYIMPTRIGASNSISEEVDIGAIERYIRKKRMQGQKGFGILHVLVATYVRVVSQYPGLNRYISNRELYARDNITVSMMIKKSLTLNAQETAIKLYFNPYSTANDVYEEMSLAIEENRQEGDHSDFDATARYLNYIPRPFLRAAIAFLRFLDNYNHLPMFLQKVSPFHCSVFITSMGSLGIPSIFHHLYDFGNCPTFISYGTKHTVSELQPDGTTLRRTMLDVKMVLDERICDGHYMASCLKAMHNIWRHPEVLDTPPNDVPEDID